MTHMRHLGAGLLSVALMWASSCATQSLWDETNPRERVWVAASEVTEQQLIDKQIPYYKSMGESEAGYLIPKSTVQRLGDYTIRVLATPITVTIDATMVVAVVGVVVLKDSNFSYSH